MSTRFVRKGNKVILGMAKNGSQAIKQLGLNNPEWKTTEDDIPEDILIDHRVTVYIPIRDELDRAISGLIQELNDEIVEKGLKDIEWFVRSKVVFDNSYYPFLSYKKIQTIEYFWRFIFLNKGWKGCKVKFFDLKYLSNKFCEHIGEDPANIPKYNTAITTPIKVEIMKYLPKKESLFKHYFHMHWKHPYSFLEKSLWNRIKTTDYWLKLREDKKENNLL